MWSQKFASLFLVLGFTDISHALPGFQARDCGKKVNGIFCENTASTTSGLTLTTSTIDTPSSITSGPSIVVQAYRRDTDDVTVVCGTDSCTKYDVTSSVIGVFPVPHFTGDPRPPLANDTEMPQPHPGPTASGTGVVSGTDIPSTSSDELNSTTFITSKVTISVLTVTRGNWSDWTSTPMGTAAGTSQQPLNSANATNIHHSFTAPGWSVWPTSTGSPHKPSSNATNSTHVSAGQTSTRAPHGPPESSCSSNETTCSSTTTSVSYFTTSTFTFAHSTVVIPIPADYSASITSAPTTTTKHTSKHTSSALVGGSISTSSCWTQTDRSSDTNSATITAATKICWILSCDENDKCTDRVSRYPITVDAQSSSLMASQTNSTLATTTISSNGSVSATVTSSSLHDTMWMTWSAGWNATTTPSSSHSSSSSKSKSTSRHSTTHTRSVDATSTSPSSSSSQSTFAPWLSWTSTTHTAKPKSTMSSDPIAHPSLSADGTMTETVYPLPATDTETAAAMTSDDAFQLRGAMMNRKRYLREQRRKGGIERKEEVGMYE